MSIAFSGVGVGSVRLSPWLQGLIVRAGWRSACFALGILVLVLLLPLNLLVRRRPQDIGIEPDGDRAAQRFHTRWPTIQCRRRRLGRCRLDARSGADDTSFRWIALGYFCALFAACSAGPPEEVLWWKSASRRASPPGRRRRQPCGDTGSDRARPSLRPDRTRVRLGASGALGWRCVLPAAAHAAPDCRCRLRWVPDDRGGRGRWATASPRSSARSRRRSFKDVITVRSSAR